MAPVILLVDDQRDILLLLRSALNTLKHPELEILEAASGEEALEEVSRRRVDLLVTNYNLPGITGIGLLHKIRARQPEIQAILTTGTTDRKLRDEMLNAGAVGIFSRPVPLGDFLDAVERGLGLTRTIFPVGTEQEPETGPLRVSDLLANLRQDLNASGAFLINDRGLVVARAGDLRDRSMEVSLISALAANIGAGIKVAKSNRQEALDQFSVFSGGDHDLISMPIDASYSLLLAGSNLSARENLSETIGAMLAVRKEVSRSLRSMGAAGEPVADTPKRTTRDKTGELAATAPELETLLSGAGSAPVTQEELDAFWNEAAAKHANKPMSKDVIPFAKARKMGLTPDREE